MGRALRKIGFDVSQHIDLDRIGMERAFREFIKNASNAQIALIFYAGHGIQLDGKNVLVPIDARFDRGSDINSQIVYVDRILGALSSRTRANIVILDACRDNPFALQLAAESGLSHPTAMARGLAAYSATENVGRGLGTGNLIAFATAPGQVALDGDGTVDSPFTTGLLKHLATPGLEVRSMLARVRADVAAATANQQIPWDNSSLLEEVYLAGIPPAGNKIAPDEIAWNAISGTTDLAALQEFIRTYPESRHRADAEKRIVAISPPMPDNRHSAHPRSSCFVFNGERYCQ